MYHSALVIGAGAFGTSIASVLSHNFKNVVLKVRSEDNYSNLQAGENNIYLPGLKLPTNIQPVMNWDDVAKLASEVQLIIFGLPTSALNIFCQQHQDKILPFLKRGVPIVSLSKGIDHDTLLLPDEIYGKYFSEYNDLFTFLSGPSFAKEIVEKQITIVSLAGRSRLRLMEISEMLKTDYFKCFPTYDIKGVLLGGALKNVLSICSGIIEGLGYNHNTRAAMITRGIVEMLRFGKVYNARPETFYGFSGMGDLILTSTGDLSRNKVFGLEIAKGRKPEDIIESQRSVVEGYKTTKAAHLLSKKYGISARMFDGLYRVLYEGEHPNVVIDEMMSQPIKIEDL